MHGISSHPRGRSAEYLLSTLTTQVIVPPLLKKNTSIHLKLAGQLQYFSRF